MSFSLATKRLILEDISVQDLEEIQRLALHESVMKYVMIWLDDEGQVAAFVKHAVHEAQRNDRMEYLLVVRIAQTREFAGITFIEIDPSSPTTAEVGCVLLPDFWRNGYATEVLRALLAFGFGPLALHRVYGKCDERNIPPARSMVRIGLKYEGTLREHVWLRDHWRSTRYYGLLAGEYSP